MKARAAGSPLTPDAAIRLLCAHHLLDAAELVDGNVSVAEVRGRNLNLRVESSGPRSYLIKQAAPGESADPLNVEAWFYRRVGEAGGVRLRPYVPHLAAADARRRFIVLDLIPGALTADLLVDDAPMGTMPRLGEPLGRAIGACHAAFPHRLRGGPRAVRPWIFDIPEPAPEMMRHLAPAQVTLIGLLQEHDAAMTRLARLRRDWTASTLIHGDIKWSNVLVLEGGAGTPAAVRLIDWEFATWGDPAWDVGSALHSFLVDCIAHAASVADSATDAATAFAGALPRAHPEIRRFCAAYFNERGLAGSAADELVDRAILHCGVRLVQTAYESCERVEDMPRFAAAELQLALNILDRADAARRTVLGLPTSTRRASG